MIQKRQRRDRSGKAYSVWRVRFEDAAGRERSKTLPRGTTKREAEAFESRVKLLKATGELAVLDRGRETLADFVVDWWELYAAHNLARSTLEVYSVVWNKHLADRVGGLALRELTPETIVRLRQDLERAGAGNATIRKALAMLQGVLARAVEWQRISANPVAAVRKPSAQRVRAIEVVAPERIEVMRRFLLDRKQPKLRDATLLSILAYAGLRPWSEATALTWGDVGERALRVYAPKTRRGRTVEVLPPLRADLATWRLACGRPGPKALVFGEWTDGRVRNWRRRTWAAALEAADLPTSMRPYDLRHSYASLLISEGRSAVEVAQQLGHSPTMCLETYSHVFAEWTPGARVSAEERIRAAREGRQERRATG